MSMPIVLVVFVQILDEDWISVGSFGIDTMITLGMSTVCCLSSVVITLSLLSLRSNTIGLLENCIRLESLYFSRPRPHRGVWDPFH